MFPWALLGEGTREDSSVLLCSSTSRSMVKNQKAIAQAQAVNSEGNDYELSIKFLAAMECFPVMAATSHMGLLTSEIVRVARSNIFVVLLTSYTFLCA